MSSPLTLREAVQYDCAGVIRVIMDNYYSASLPTISTHDIEIAKQMCVFQKKQHLLEFFEKK
jgi:hypothetical protein